MSITDKDKGGASPTPTPNPVKGMLIAAVTYCIYGKRTTEIQFKVDILSDDELEAYLAFPSLAYRKINDNFAEYIGEELLSTCYKHIGSVRLITPIETYYL